MLVLTRKQEEKIVIGGNVIVQVIEIRGDKVRLGIIAPDNVSIHREEVAKDITRNGGDSTRSLANRPAA